MGQQEGSHLLHRKHGSVIIGQRHRLEVLQRRVGLQGEVEAMLN